METKVTVSKKSEVVDNSTASMIEKAFGVNMTPDQMIQLINIKERVDAIEAKKAYVRAMADFKANAPLVGKDKVNNQYKSKYTSLGNLVNTVNPVLSRFGLSASWDVKQNGIVEVTCKMTHFLGHSETATMSAPADTSGAKNVIQQIKSTVTYLKASTFECITGTASTDANLDDDANGAYGVEYITDVEKSNIVDLCTAKNVNMPKFLEYLGVESLDVLPKAKLGVAITAISKKVSK